MPRQKTLSIIKPDISKVSLIGEIINILEKKGLKIVGMKMVQLTPQQAEFFYQEHQSKPFFREVVKFMCSSPVVVMCLEGENAIQLNREIMGATDPQMAKVRTIRRIYGESIGANAVHGSDSPQAAEREINFFFKKEEIFS
ncbi:MAG: nucleoside-diphosphate kinase [Candidatus Moeniiplasma glomeromycotorum]|nr:nucleoside-diphosphate kinase [Candidatus Moeniiplasma glomeromycotorum]MCE8167176.1 nucleoside-diphosphate kinase [Candidatus Moeniiplasma glomeromycotorum]MCE8168812.1 nucleoside-diphosphate kinase [Candidatus Moeniiplasma glomeromycotorum]